MIDLVATVKTARSIANAIEGGAIESTFADLGLRAAKDALSKVLYAEDKSQQVWSAVNHLEAAEAALRDTLQKRGKRLLYSNMGALWEAIDKRRYILGLMAVCYRYLGERALTERTLSMIPHADEGYQAISDRRWVPPALANLVSPSMWTDVGKDMWRSEAAERTARRMGASQEAVARAGRIALFNQQYTYDIPSFSRSLTATWRNSPRDLLNFREYGL
jgi:hypothetical protein